MSDRLQEIEARLSRGYVFDRPGDVVVSWNRDLTWAVAEVKRLRQELGAWQLSHMPSIPSCEHEWTPIITPNNSNNVIWTRCAKCGQTQAASGPWK